MSRGGKRENAGRKASAPTATHPVRCTDKGWEWLQSQAFSKGHTSVGKWADAAGRKAPKKKGNEALQRPDEVGSVARSGSPAKRESGPQQSAEAPRSPAKREIDQILPTCATGGTTEETK